MRAAAMVVLAGLASAWAGPTPVFVATGSMSGTRAQGASVTLPSGRILITGGLNSSGAPVATAELYDPALGRFLATGSMTTARYCHTATVLPNGLVLIAGGSDGSNFLSSSELYNPNAGTFTAGPVMSSAHCLGTATLVPDGFVMVAGGEGVSGAANALIDLYYPALNAFGLAPLLVARQEHTATLLGNGKVLFTGGFDNSSPPNCLSSAEIYDPGNGTGALTASMSVPRADHTATLLPDGNVLIAGGVSGTLFPALSSAEEYNPFFGTFGPTFSAMTVGRRLQTATPLNNGQVLIAGGWNDAGALNEAELYDPTSLKFTPTASMVNVRGLAAAAQLVNGLVLVAGGKAPSTASISSAELYDYAPGTYLPNAAMATARQFHTASALTNGYVLITGGKNSFGVAKTTELYGGGNFRAGPVMSTARAFHTATDLGSGVFLIAGGQDGAGNVLATAQKYTQSTTAFSATGNNMASARLGHTATRAGTIALLAGGMDGSGHALSSTEEYSISLSTFAAGGALTTARVFHAATQLLNGTVLITGGNNASNVPLASAEIYTPATHTSVAVAAAMHSARAFHSAVLLANGEVLIAGGVNASGPVTSAEIYDPTNQSFTVVSPMGTARSLFGATRLLDGDVMIAGGENAADAALGSGELFDPFLGQFRAVPGPMQSARFGHTATLMQTGMVLLAGGVDGTSSVTPSTEFYDPPAGPTSLGLSLTLTSPGEIAVHRGRSVVAATMELANLTHEVQTANSLTLAASDPSLFSAMTLRPKRSRSKATIYNPGPNNVLVFNPPLKLAPDATVSLSLKVTLARPSHSGGSTQAVTLLDGSGPSGAVTVGNLPLIVGTVTRPAGR